MSDETNTEAHVHAHEATTEPHGEVPSVLTAEQLLEISKEASNVLGEGFEALVERCLKRYGGEGAVSPETVDPKVVELQREVVKIAMEGCGIALAVLAVTNGVEVGDFAKEMVDSWTTARNAMNRHGVERFLGTVLESIENQGIMSAADRHPKA